MVWKHGATKALAWLPGQVKVRFSQAVLKDQEITAAQIGQAKNVLWTYDFQYKDNYFSFWGK